MTAARINSAIEATTASLKRAQAAVAAAQPVAMRGMFALVEQRHSYVSLRDGRHEYRRWVPGIVTSVSRDGVAQRVSVAGHGADLRLDRRDWLFVYVDNRGTIADPAAVAGRLVTEYGVAVEFESIEAAQAAIRAAAGLTGERAL